MIFFGCENLTKQSVSQVIPWEFKPAEMPSEKVRLDKVERQYFYKNPATCWQFYTLTEGSNPNQRVSKDNSPCALHGIAADYDVAIPQSRVDEVIASLKIKPSWTERSLGGNVRLVWLFARPLVLDGYDFAVYLLDKSRSWLSLDMLPGLDVPALTDPTRLYCNGNAWTSTGAPAISERELQAFFVASGKEFRFNSADDCAIPLDVVEKALREKFPNFDWPGEFTLESQGSSFWLPGSTSPMSAICKKDGMFTFSAHATKPFYPWSDILGGEFVAEFTKTSVASATLDVYWDGKAFWQKANGRYHDCAKDELTLFFRCDCKLSAKPGKGGVSQQDIALRHIQSQNRIVGAAPFVFYPSGLFNFMGQPTLNTSTIKVMPPASEPGIWGDGGNFPWLSRHFDNFFDPDTQLPHFLAWWKAFYESGLNLRPMPGQNVFFMGGVGTGKTMTSHAILGKSVGGFQDASKYLTANSDFNSELTAVPLWTVDDETVGENSRAQSNFAALWKRTAANQTMRSHKKFGIPVMVMWSGRIVATSNLDSVSSRIVGPLDNSSLDKTSLFKCAAESRIVFPNRHDLVVIIERELPHLLRWLVDWTPPDFVKRDIRYGYRAFHEESLLDTAHQSSNSAPFSELLIESLENWFSANPEATEFKGSLTQIMRLLQSNPMNSEVMRTLRLQSTARYLESLQRSGILNCRVEVGNLKTRIWVFQRFGAQTAPTKAPEAALPASNAISIFSK